MGQQQTSGADIGRSRTTGGATYCSKHSNDLSPQTNCDPFRGISITRRTAKLASFGASTVYIIYKQPIKAALIFYVSAQVNSPSDLCVSGV